LAFADGLRDRGKDRTLTDKEVDAAIGAALEQLKGMDILLRS